jgi:hypothetical protein
LPRFLPDSFTDTDLTEQRFLNCRLINNTILSLTDGCTLDFDYNIHLEEVFVENLVGMCAMLPGAFLSGETIELCNAFSDKEPMVTSYTLFADFT